MIKDSDYKVISDKFLDTAQDCFRNNETVNLSVLSGIDIETMQPFVAAKLEDDEDKAFMFTPEQAKTFTHSMAFSMQMSRDKVYLDFARAVVEYFSEAITALKEIEGDIVGVVIRKNKKY
jgi:transaldolase